jgi:hypothetical protein
VLNLPKEFKNKLCNFGTLITLRYQYLLAEETLATFLKNQNMEESLSQNYITSAWGKMAIKYPEVRIILNDLVKKSKESLI